MASSSLRNLSDEILLLIIDNVERTSLPAFIRASHQIHQLGTPVLYRFIEYGFPKIGTRKPGLVQLKYGMEGSLRDICPSRVSVIFDILRFINTLEKNQNLRPFVMGASLNINWNDAIWNQDAIVSRFPKRYSDAIISHLIELISPSLKYLEVKPSVVNLSLLSSVPSAALELPVMQMLGADHTEPITLREFKALFKVRSIRHIGLSWFGRSVLSMGKLSNADLGISPVTSLAFPSVALRRKLITTSWPFNYEIDRTPLLAIAIFIGWTLELRCLHLGSIAHPDVEILLQTGFMDSLLKHTDSLEELFIDLPKIRTMTYHPACIIKMRCLPAGLSMAGFTHLKRLGMAEAFLPCRSEGDVLELPSTQLWQLLPPTLEELQLEFSSAFENDLEVSPIFWACCNSLLPTYEAVALNDSLHGILAHRFDHFPRLRYLVLWCTNLDNKITFQSIFRPFLHKRPTSGSTMDLASDAVAFWLDLFGVSAAFKEARIRFEWSVDPSPPLFNPMNTIRDQDILE
ncbi:hypothetical protein V8E51_001733 [Hyaloscypha variabilis]